MTDAPNEKHHCLRSEDPHRPPEGGRIRQRREAWIWLDANGQGTFDQPLLPIPVKEQTFQSQNRRRRRPFCTQPKTLSDFVKLLLAAILFYLVDRRLSEPSPPPQPTFRDTTHDAFLKTHKHVFVYYHEPGSNRTPELVWQKFSDRVASSRLPVETVSLDCRRYAETCRRAIHASPTLQWYQNSEPILPAFDLHKVTVNDLYKYALQRMEREAEMPAVLTTLTFDGFLRGHPQVFCLFYDSSSTTADAIKDVWNALAVQALESSNLVVRIAKIDCYEHPQICQRQSIPAPVTLRYFANQEAVTPDYQGPYEVEALADYARANFRVTPAVNTGGGTEQDDGLD